jgi:hypothetical protein
MPSWNAELCRQQAAAPAEDPVHRVPGAEAIHLRFNETPGTVEWRQLIESPWRPPRGDGGY